jgi:hypothetical protein
LFALLRADYRYGDYGGMMESGTHAMEVITALIDGPLCFLVAFAAAHDLSWRHPLQIILCTMQLYGLVWFTLQPIWSETGLAGHFSSDPVRAVLQCLVGDVVICCVAGDVMCTFVAPFTQLTQTAYC